MQAFFFLRPPCPAPPRPARPLSPPQVTHMAASQGVMGPQFASRLPLVLFAALVISTVVAINGYVLVDFLKEHLPQVRGGAGQGGAGRGGAGRGGAGRGGAGRGGALRCVFCVCV